MPLPIPPRQPDSPPVLNSTPLPAFPQLWQLQPPKDALILVVKGTFDLQQAAPATPSEEQALPLGPTLFEEAEEALAYPGDMAFFKPRCDLFVSGFAYSSPKNTKVRRVEFNFGKDFSHAIAAIGDRRWERGVPSQAARFDKLELRPELAYGGHGDERNPAGVGRLTEDGLPLPNFELPDRLIRSPNDHPPPALLTPLAEQWTGRTRFQGTYGKDWANTRAPYFPDDFRWDYYQAAATVLQVPHPRGDEWYRLAGVRPNDEVLEGQLPCLKMRAFAQSKERPDELVELPLNLDTVYFEPELLRVQLVWRGAISVTDQYATDLASLLLIAEPIGKPCAEEEIERRFVAAHRAEYVREPEVEEPDPLEPPPSPPEGYVPPIGLNARAAIALGLPAWAATVESPPLPPAPSPPPRPAQTPNTIDQLLASGDSLAGADLSHCDLSGRDLSSRDLTDANLEGTNLDAANLSRANLAGANLTDASLVGADLSQADLLRAVLERANLEGAKLDQVRLAEALLTGSRAAGASFLGALLDRATIHEADWTGVKMDGASLVATDFTGTTLEDASLVGAKMADIRLYDVVAPRIIADDADMAGCRIDGAVFSGGSFARIQAADSSMRSCDFSDCNLMEAVLEKSVLEDAVFDRANVNQVEAKECRWQRARASGATFVKSNLMGGIFEGASLKDCDMRGANMYDCDTFRASFTGCGLEHAILGISGLD